MKCSTWNHETGRCVTDKIRGGWLHTICYRLVWTATIAATRNRFFIVWASSCNPLLGLARGRCWAAIRLSRHPEASGNAPHREVEGLDNRGQHVRWSVLLRHTHKPQKDHTPFVQAGAGTSDTGAEAVKPDPRSSWQGHCRRVGADVGETTLLLRLTFKPWTS